MVLPPHLKRRKSALVSRRRTADKDSIEYFECEQEMNEELYEQYYKAERIIGILSPFHL